MLYFGHYIRKSEEQFIESAAGTSEYLFSVFSFIAYKVIISFLPKEIFLNTIINMISDSLQPDRQFYPQFNSLFQPARTNPSESNGYLTCLRVNEKTNHLALISSRPNVNSEVYAILGQDIVQKFHQPLTMHPSHWTRLDLGVPAIENYGKSKQSNNVVAHDLNFDASTTGQNCLLVAALSNASAPIWDLRLPTTVSSQSMQNHVLSPVIRVCDQERRAYLSCALFGHHLACGTELSKEDAKIRLWDLRMPEKVVGQLVHSLGDDCTQLEFFHSGGASGDEAGLRLLSGSTDGLCCLYDYDHVLSNTEVKKSEPGNDVAMDTESAMIDPKEQFGNGEDDALLTVLNTNSSVSKFGRFGPTNTEYLWTFTHTEQLTLWSLSTGTKLADLGDIRSYFSPELNINYVIDAVFNANVGELRLFCGSYDGTMHQVLVQMNGLKLEQSWSGAHEDVVRSVVILSDYNNLPLLITCGEDGKVVGWKMGSSTNSGLISPKENLPASSKATAKRGFKPY